MTENNRITKDDVSLASAAGGHLSSRSPEYGCTLARNALVAFVIVLGVTSALGSSEGEEAFNEKLRARQEAAEEFKRRLRAASLAEAAKTAAAEEVAWERRMAEWERERLRRDFAIRNGPKNWEEVERLDRVNELEIERRAKERDKLREAYTRLRDRFHERLAAAEAAIDEDLEFGLENRDKNRVRPIRPYVESRDLRKK